MNYSDEMDRIMSIVLYREDEVKDLKDEEMPQGCIFVRGLAHNFGFHPERLLDSAEDVRKILNAVVADEFMGAEGGWSFLNLVVGRNSEIWGNQVDAEGLLCLALGLGWAEILVPRSMWQMMPGGVPYVRFNFTDKPKLTSEAQTKD